jgi:hypothetical protein
MALSEREQKLLEELERGLLDGDSGLDSKAKRLGNPAGRLIGGALVAVIGVVVLLTAVLAQIALIGVAGFLIMLAGLVIAHLKPSTTEHLCRFRQGSARLAKARQELL